MAIITEHKKHLLRKKSYPDEETDQSAETVSACLVLQSALLIAKQPALSSEPSDTCVLLSNVIIQT